jgi:hypothetical protein
MNHDADLFLDAHRIATWFVNVTECILQIVMIVELNSAFVWYSEYRFTSTYSTRFFPCIWQLYVLIHTPVYSGTPRTRSGTGSVFNNQYPGVIVILSAVRELEKTQGS